MKVAVTGASGFIGQYVLTQLADYAEVVAITRNADHLASWKSKVQVIEMDIDNATSNTFNDIGRPDVLIHLAWDGLPNYKSLHHFETELPKQYQFLKKLITAGLPSLLVSGTCFEYGMQSGELSESQAALPTNCYGYAKHMLRRQLEFLRESQPFGFTWARLFYVYGAGQSEGSLYSQFTKAIANKEKEFHMSGGEQLRDYMQVEEAAKLIAQLACQRVEAGVINICTGKPVSVRALVEKWRSENEADIALVLGHYPYPDYEPMSFWGNRQHLDSVLGTR